MGHTHAKLTYHCIFSTKDRRPFITESVRERLYPYVESIVRASGGSLLVVGGAPEHVHILLELPASVPVADAMRLIKTNSSKWIRETASIVSSRILLLSPRASHSPSFSVCGQLQIIRGFATAEQKGNLQRECFNNQDTDDQHYQDQVE